MKNTLFLFLLAACQLACRQSAPESTPQVAAMHAAQFLQRFKPVEADTFYIASASDEAGIARAGFVGQMLDSTALTFLDGLESLAGGRFYACYRFPVSDSVTGLILRSPSEYWDSSIRIFLFDEKKNKTFANLEAAEEWGDAGDAVSKAALLVREKSGWKILLFQTICHPADESLDEIVCADSTITYRVLPRGYQEISRAASDTVVVYPLLRRFDRSGN